MKVLVCGGRNYSNDLVVNRILDQIHACSPISMLIEGGATGADALGAAWACARGVLHVAVPADWGKHGKAAGPIRNQEMIEMRPDHVVAFAGGRGTADMVRRAKAASVFLTEIP